MVLTITLNRISNKTGNQGMGWGEHFRREATNRVCQKDSLLWCPSCDLAADMAISRVQAELDISKMVTSLGKREQPGHRSLEGRQIPQVTSSGLLAKRHMLCNESKGTGAKLKTRNLSHTENERVCQAHWSMGSTNESTLQKLGGKCSLPSNIFICRDMIPFAPQCDCSVLSSSPVNEPNILPDPFQHLHFMVLWKRQKEKREFLSGRNSETAITCTFHTFTL